ncbi:fic/DOC family protein [Solibacillus sp. R5-41]|uniref:Fic/DOC family protein n=1 Tax=Solibacillus sp. R5-41 TaxID=2048654 RepID=UPI000C128D58|nr:Fic family protein [Solibacillus sp. R5-41]ATP39655.1 fic/DOC family protein [Solibacillus sp. R5-41]
MDPYVYKNSNVLQNKLNIQDEQQLITVEAQLLIAGILDIDSILPEINFNHFSSLQKIHHHLFQLIYEWAGEFRTINIYKNEKVLGGVSVTYSHFKQIQTDLQAIFTWASTINWSVSNPLLAKDFSTLMTDIWRVHSYREGNTRTVSIFMKLFADSKGLSFNEQLLSDNAGYLRNALVLASVEESPEPEHLLKIITDALGLTEIKSVAHDQLNVEKYQTIRQYNVSTYEEQPFTIHPKSNIDD